MSAQRVKSFRRKRSFKRPTEPSFSPRPNGEPPRKDPVIGLLQELRNCTDGTREGILRRLAAQAERERDRGSDYTNLDAAVKRIVARPLTDVEAGIVRRMACK